MSIYPYNSPWRVSFGDADAPHLPPEFMSLPDRHLQTADAVWIAAGLGPRDLDRR